MFFVYVVVNNANCLSTVAMFSIRSSNDQMKEGYPHISFTCWENGKKFWRQYLHILLKFSYFYLMAYFHREWIKYKLPYNNSDNS